MNRNVACLFLITFLTISAFGGNMPPEANKLRDGYLPTPFSAEQIKSFCKPGYTTRHLFENEGQKAVVQTARFIESGNPNMARFSSRQESLTGELVKDDGVMDVPWTQLQAHASFPENITKVSEADYELDGKTYSCWKYVVNNMVPSQDGSKVTAVEMTFWFAKDLPGPPIKMVQEIEGKKGVSMTMLFEEKCCEEEKTCCEAEKEVEKACCEVEAEDEKACCESEAEVEKACCESEAEDEKACCESEEEVPETDESTPG